jgi:ribose 5-phosphate isomerase B
MTKVFIASDHAGFEYKKALVPFLIEKGFEVEDLGPFELNPADDYPDFIRPLAESVAQNKDTFGIVIGGSGEGEAMDANRIAGVRAAEYYGHTPEILKASREHNDANVLSLGARFISLDEAKEAVLLWLTTPFSGDERHARRIAELDQK